MTDAAEADKDCYYKADCTPVADSSAEDTPDKVHYYTHLHKAAVHTPAPGSCWAAVACSSST